jgi:hypothetical protein
MADSALLTIPRNNTTVKIDGYLNDKCWENASGAVLIPNTPEDNRQFENGCFQIIYDQQNIYIGGMLEQSFLDPELNKLDLVKNKAETDNDPRIYRDDIVELFLQTPDAREYWHFVINSSGKILRSKVSMDNGYEKMQPECGIQIKTCSTTKRWSFEIAVPVELFGGNKINKGRKLLLGLFRNNNPKSEITAWTPSLPNFNQTAQWGEIVFEETEMTVQGTSINTTQSRIESSIKLNEGRYRLIGTLNINPLKIEKTGQTLIMEGKTDGNTGTTQITVINDDSGKTLWRSPILKTAVKPTTAQINLNIPGQFKLTVNRELICSGYNNIIRDLNLPAKINVIALEIEGENRPLSGTLQLGMLKIEPSQWLISDKAIPNWMNEDCNVSNFNLYDGKPINGKTYLRFAVLRNHTLFAPQRPDGQLYLANGIVNSWALRIGSPLTCPLPDYELNINIPEELKIPLYDFNRRFYSRYKHNFSNQVNNGRRQLSFKFHLPMPRLDYNWGYNVINFLVKPDFSNSVKNTVIPVYIWQRGRGLAEYPQEYKLNILPELNAISPKKTVISLWDCERDTCFTLDEMKLVLETFSKTGINYVGIIDTQNSDEDLAANRLAHELGMKSIMTHCANSSQFLRERLKEKPQFKIENPVYARPSWKPGMCPLAFLSDPWIKTYYEKRFPLYNIFMDDVERGINGSCLCLNCRQELAKRFNLGTVPDAASVYREYQNELIKFQIDLNRQMVDYQLTLAQNVNPQIRSAVYSGYDSPDTKITYGMDWQRYRDVDYPSAGYVINNEIINATRKNLNGKQMICGYILNSNLYEKPLSQQNIKAVLFHQVRNSGFGGVLIWMWRELDGRGYHAIADFARGVATFEPFLSESNVINPAPICTGMAKETVSVYKLNGQYLILAVNMQKTAKKLKVRLPEEISQAEVFDFYRNEKKIVKESFSSEIPANDVGLILIKPSNQ